VKFAVLKGEKDVADLASRLFEMKGRGSAEAYKKAEAALIAANPHLKDLAKLPEGTLIVVPSLPGTPPSKSTQTTSGSSQFSEQAKLMLKELSAAFARSSDSEEKAIAAAMDLLKSKEVKDFVAQLPDAQDQADKLNEALKNQQKDLKASTATQKDALAQLQNSLEKS
jgi:ubiquinone biosynthesis protein Coq4